MADDTASLTAKDLPKLPLEDSSFLNSGDIPKQAAQRDAVAAAAHPGTMHGRRPLFRN
jgi:hypothetical protein